MPLKTLHLTNSWHETSGGIATFYRALIQQANLPSQYICLVVPDQNDSVEEAGEFGKIYHVQAPLAPLNSVYRTIYPAQFLAPGSKLQKILAAERPDLVEICDKYTLNYLGVLLRRRLLAGLDCRPVVVGLSCERMDDNFRSYIGPIPLAGRFCSLYMKWLYFPFFDHHIANSLYTAAELRAAGQGQITDRGTWVLPMGADLGHLSPLRRSQQARRRLLQKFGATEESHLLLYAGRLVPEKNLALLFELLMHLAKDREADYRLLVAGDGIEGQRWEQVCNQRIPGRVLFLGHIKDRGVLADLYANVDVFVHPNPREPFGIAPLEAMASGTPLVAPNSGGVTSYANSQNAWTVDATVEDFAAAVKQVIENEGLRGEKIARAAATAQEYRWEKVTSSFLDLYSELFRAARAPQLSGFAPSFHSTSSLGAEAVFFRAFSQTAEATFRFISALAFNPKPNRRGWGEPFH